MPISTRLGTLRDDGSRKCVHPADVSGKYTRRRHVVFAVLLVLLVVVPWLRVSGNPLLLFDIARRRFFVLGRVFGASDGWLFFFVLSGIGFVLIAVTALWGRVYCGYVCPQTVFIEGVYRKLERIAMGRPEQRRRWDASPPSPEKIARTCIKHLLYAVVSLFFAHVVLGYFVPARDLLSMMRAGPSAHPEAFSWVVGLSALFHVDFGWFREQFCTIMCPYGRLQGILTDEHSLGIGYDRRRGEPRGKVALKLVGACVGDCIDCKRCVVVCPTGIDIRNGTQLECIACAACIDACDEMMRKVGRSPGLIRYDSDVGLAGKPTRWVRPRTVAYAIAGVVGLVVMTVSLRVQSVFDVVVLRPQGLPYLVQGEELRNPLRVRLTNKDAKTHDFSVAVSAPPGVNAVVALPSVSLPPSGVVDVPVLLVMNRDARGSLPRVELRVERRDGRVRSTEIQLMGP